MTTYIFISTNEAGDTMTAYFGPTPNPLPSPLTYPNDEKVWPYQKAVASTDPLYVAYYDLWNGAFLGLVAPGS
jgi:hypothetical protein